MHVGDGDEEASKRGNRRIVVCSEVVMVCVQAEGKKAECPRDRTPTLFLGGIGSYRNKPMTSFVSGSSQPRRCSLKTEVNPRRFDALAVSVGM